MRLRGLDSSLDSSALEVNRVAMRAYSSLKLGPCGSIHTALSNMSTFMPYMLLSRTSDILHHQSVLKVIELIRYLLQMVESVVVEAAATAEAGVHAF